MSGEINKTRGPNTLPVNKDTSPVNGSKNKAFQAEFDGKTQESQIAKDRSGKKKAVAYADAGGVKQAHERLNNVIQGGISKDPAQMVKGLIKHPVFEALDPKRQQEFVNMLADAYGPAWDKFLGGQGADAKPMKRV